MATPAFAALLWLGEFPPARTVVLGLVTVFAGYTAVYALNDLIDYRIDREKAQMAGGLRESENYLDAAIIRHPMAQGFLSFKEGLLWTVGWSAIALIGAVLLNPVCVLIFLTGCLLEAVYCGLLRISPFRTVISGSVKTAGAIAAVFAVDPTPSAAFVLTLFFWLFFWEIGGQNIPNDWADVEEDRRLQAQTVPVRFGPEKAARFVVAALGLSLAAKLIMIIQSGLALKGPFALASLAAGGWLLMPAAVRLLQTRRRIQAMELFNRASYYPPVMLLLVLIAIVLF
jgi:4-hydroxybenzoate polyprenyltransferase